MSVDWYRLALARLAPLMSALTNVAPSKLCSVRVAPVRVAPMSVDWIGWRWQG